MVYLRRLYPFKFFKECLPQILLGPFLNTLSHLILSSEIMMGNCGTQLIYSNYSRSTNSFTALEANFADLLQRRYPENLTMEILQTFHNSNFEEHLSLSASAFSVYKNDVIGLWQMNHSVLKNQVWLSHEYFLSQLENNRSSNLQAVYKMTVMENARIYTLRSVP